MGWLQCIGILKLVWIAAVVINADKESRRVNPKRVTKDNLASLSRASIRLERPCELHCGDKEVASGVREIFSKSNKEETLSTEFLYGNKILVFNFTARRIEKLKKEYRKTDLLYKIKEASCTKRQYFIELNRDIGIKAISKRQHENGGLIRSPEAPYSYRNIVTKTNNTHNVTLSTHLGYGFEIRAIHMDMPRHSGPGCNTLKDDYLYISTEPYNKLSVDGSSHRDKAYCGKELFHKIIYCPHVTVKLVKKYTTGTWNGFILSYRVIKLENDRDRYCCYSCTGQNRNVSQCIRDGPIPPSTTVPDDLKIPSSLERNRNPSDSQHTDLSAEKEPNKIQSLERKRGTTFPQHTTLPGLVESLPTPKEERPYFDANGKDAVKAVESRNYMPYLIVIGAILILLVAMIFFTLSCIYHGQRMDRSESKMTLTGMYIDTDRPIVGPTVE